MQKLFTGLLISLFALGAPASEIKTDETIEFFPSLGWQNPDSSWTLQIRGWVFEQERRPGVATSFRKAIGMHSSDMTESELKIYGERSRLFLIDVERDKPVAIRLGRDTFPVGKSAIDGRFSADLILSNPQVKQLQTNGSIPFTAVLPDKDRRVFAGTVHLVSDRGLSVISDLDDTIKISNVRKRDELLRNTFSRPFKVVPGMADAYKAWSKTTNVTFHYVSASPSQLRAPIAQFLEENQFPAGSVHLSVFDWRKQLSQKHGSLAAGYKPGVIEPILKQFPQRRFVLVGDSGELDPEIYGEIARKFPAQIHRIFIRDVTNDDAERYAKAFREIPTATWNIFREPSEMKLDK